jgi:hypothetical protein
MRMLKTELWPYRVKVNEKATNDITAIEIWLGETLGTFKNRWNVVYHYDRTDFYFKQQDDAMIFSLRWS